MCLIIHAKENRPKPDYIANGARTNSDGIGIAWREEGYLRYRKGLSIDETVELAATLPLDYVIHFRMASIGGKSEKLIHPFPIRLDVPLKQQGKSNKLLFHNGHWADWEKTLLNNLSYRITLPDGIWSDTRALALLTALHGKGFLQLLGGDNRFILMTAKSTSAIGDFIEDDGVFYSNGGYKYGSSGYPTSQVHYGGKGKRNRFNSQTNDYRHDGCGGVGMSSCYD